MAVVLREVERSDFSQIENLFVEVYGKEPVDGFKKAFLDHDLLLGFCLIDDTLDINAMVGYFGCFTYHRTIEDTNYKFYNSHTWIVKEDYRKHSLKLLMPYIRLKDGIVTNFSANGKVAQILEQLKFEKLRIVNKILKSSFNIKSYFEQRKIKSITVKDETTIKHNPYVGLCLNLRLPRNDKSVELVLKAVNNKPNWVKSINRFSNAIIKKPFITRRYFLYKIHYTNDPVCLLENLDIIRHYLLVKKKVGGLVIPESIIENIPSKQIENEYEDEAYVKAGRHKIPKIDYLFSEVFYLNIRDK